MKRDQIGLVALMLPVSAYLLSLAAIFFAPANMHGIATALTLASIMIAFASVPFAGVVAICARQTNRRRMTRALIGFALGLGLWVAFGYGTWLANTQVRAIREQQEIQAEQGMGLDAE